MCSIPSQYGMMIAVVNCCDFQIPLVEYVVLCCVGTEEMMIVSAK